MVGKIKAEIKSLVQVAEDTLQVSFKPLEKFEFLPGQYMIIDIPQLVTQQKRTRHFSIASSPDEKEIRIAFRRGFSDFKKFLQDEDNIGQEVTLLGPFGRFFLSEEKSELVFIAGGIGITPFMDLIPYSLKHNLGHKITLIYTNNSEQRAVFLRELKELDKKYEDFNLISIIGRADANFIKKHIKNLKAKHFFICGTDAMVDSVKEMLSSELKILPEKIHFEGFSGY